MNAIKSLTIILSALCICPAVIAKDTPTARISKETAQKTAVSAVPGGQVLSWALELDEGKPTYAFDIKGKDGRINEVEIDGNSGKQTEMSIEIESFRAGKKTTTTNQKDLAVLKKAKLTSEQAEKFALKKVPGSVEQWETEIDDGKLIYEFLIMTKSNQKKIVEIDAGTGKVLETSTFIDGDGI